MEKKTNKTKLEISYFWENQLYRKAEGYDKIGGNYALPPYSIKKNMLIRVFCMQNSYLRWKQFKFLRFSWKMKKNRKINNFGNFCEFFEIFNETLEQNIRKSQEMCFFRWKRRQIKQNEKFSNFWWNQFFFAKLEIIMPYQQILQEYAY